MSLLEHRMYRCCCVIFTLLWKTTVAHSENGNDPLHVRTWTAWYNTDDPTLGAGDDESVVRIRQRGYEICEDNSPIDAVCRDASSYIDVFYSNTTNFLGDRLIIPCNTLGVVCRNVDQRNSTCIDYEIKFECLSQSEVVARENIGVIGVAAGLSVVLPILCVAIMHCARLLRESRNPGRQRLDNSEQSVQTENSDLPPSYSVLFGDDIDNTDSVLNTSPSITRLSLTDSSGNLIVQNTRLSSSRLQSITDNQLDISINQYDVSINQSDVSINQSDVIISSREAEHLRNSYYSPDHQQQTSWHSRFPNMHLSVFDLFTSSDQRPEPQSPDLSYVQTPPPTYKDAIVILGDQASENGDLDGKINP